MDVKRYSKAIAAVVGAVVAFGAAFAVGAQDGVVTTNEWIFIGIQVLTAVGVYGVPNKQEAS